jgi:hypothetical protein
LAATTIFSLFTVYIHTRQNNISWDSCLGSKFCALILGITGDNFTPGDKIHTWVTSLPPRGEVKNGPLPSDDIGEDASMVEAKIFRSDILGQLIPGQALQPRTSTLLQKPAAWIQCCKTVINANPMMFHSLAMQNTQRPVFLKPCRRQLRTYM